MRDTLAKLGPWSRDLFINGTRCKCHGLSGMCVPTALSSAETCPRSMQCWSPAFSCRRRMPNVSTSSIDSDDKGPGLEVGFAGAPAKTAGSLQVVKTVVKHNSRTQSGDTSTLSGWTGVKRICGCLLSRGRLARRCPGPAVACPPARFSAVHRLVHHTCRKVPNTTLRTILIFTIAQIVQ